MNKTCQIVIVKFVLLQDVFVNQFNPIFAIISGQDCIWDGSSRAVAVARREQTKRTRVQGECFVCENNMVCNVSGMYAQIDWQVQR